MVDRSRDSFDQMIKSVGRFSEEAFHFVRDGLSHAAERVHGPESDAHQVIQAFLISHQMDWSDFRARIENDDLPEPVLEAVEAAGGCENLDRHVTGRELCWGLRDFALERWGMLASTVLESWNVRRTADFGRIVFGFIEFDMMQKQPGDTETDFEDVYSFDEAFEETMKPRNLHERGDSN